MADPSEDQVQGGFPKDGDLMPMDQQPPAGQADPGDEDDATPPPEPPKPDPLEELRRELAATKTELANVRRQIPTDPKPAQQPPKDQTNWDQLLFSNPAEAVRRIKAEAVAEASQGLTAKYNQDQNTQKFWGDFFEANKDLSKDDKDLIELMLNKHLSELANIPVADAMKRLADLTRERLLRYAGGGRRKGGKAVAEGASVPTPKTPQAPPPRVTSISDVLKARAAARRKSRNKALAS